VRYKVGPDYTRNRVGHLVEFGHKIVRKGRVVGQVEGSGFATKAYEATKGQALEAMRYRIRQTVEREASR
jgi:hypothetical protein